MLQETNALRAELRNRGVTFRVLKNTLVRLAYEDTNVAVIGPDLVGPRAAAWTDTDENVPAMAKVLVDFAKTHPNLGLVRGVLNGKLVDPSDMETLSRLPSREELLGRCPRHDDGSCQRLCQHSCSGAQIFSQRAQGH